MADTVWLWRMRSQTVLNSLGANIPGRMRGALPPSPTTASCSTRGIPNPIWARFRSVATTSLTS